MCLTILVKDAASREEAIVLDNSEPAEVGGWGVEVVLQGVARDSAARESLNDGVEAIKGVF